MIYFTRVYEFAASHRLYNDKLSDAENFEIFRECSYLNGHGHNYVLEVTMRGVPDQRTGMVVDLLALDEVVNEQVIKHVDHRHLNYDVEFLTGIIPTSENVVAAFWKELLPVVSNLGTLYRLRLHESRKNSAEYIEQER